MIVSLDSVSLFQIHLIKGILLLWEDVLLVYSLTSEKPDQKFVRSIIKILIEVIRYDSHSIPFFLCSDHFISTRDFLRIRVSR